MNISVPIHPLDEDEYPTEEALNYIENHPWQQGHQELMEFIHSIWWGSDALWYEEPDAKDEVFNRSVKRYYISTGGWSGNESIISSMHKNWIFWSSCWVQSKRGGHYIFEFYNE